MHNNNTVICLKSKVLTKHASDNAKPPPIKNIIPQGYFSWIVFQLSKVSTLPENIVN